jgi:hypothetical protein
MAISLDGVRFSEPTLAPPVPHAEAAARRAEPAHFQRLFARLAHEVDRGETLVTSGVHAGYEPRDAAQLIALQAGIYRYSEAVDLTVKLVDRTAATAKTILESGR